METRLIFCWSPGRCGTGYLAKMLQAIPGVVAKHEPLPRFSECTTRPLCFWTFEKLPAIEATGAAIYAETTHVVRGFLPSLLSLGIKPDIIQITRPHRDVALSFWRRRSIPGRTGRGKKFLMNPDFPGWQDLTGYQLCYWHSREVARRAVTISIGFDRWFPVEFDALVNRDGFGAIVDALDLPAPNWQRYNERRLWKVNSNPANYYTVFPDGDIDAQEREVDERFDG